METIARRRHWFPRIAVMVGIALSLSLLIVVSGGWNGDSGGSVRVGAPPADALDGSPILPGPAAVPVNPWAVNDPATLAPLCTQASLDPTVREAISAWCVRGTR